MRYVTQAQDGNSGEMYYYNKALHQTTWQIPGRPQASPDVLDSSEPDDYGLSNVASERYGSSHWLASPTPDLSIADKENLLQLCLGQREAITRTKRHKQEQLLKLQQLTLRRRSNKLATRKRALQRLVNRCQQYSVL